MATKAELVQNMNLYSVETLEKLHTIAQSILNPNLNQLTTVDFASMVDSVIKTGGLADTYFSQWTDRSPSDFGRFLVELFALFSDKDFWYINHYSGEGFGTTAEQYRSIVHYAKSNGYTPPSNDAASALFPIVIGAGVLEVIPRGAIELKVNAVDSLTFTNDEVSIGASGSNTTNNITFRHGKLKLSQGTFNGKSIVITDKNICTKTIQLKVANVLWAETDSFATGNNTTKHFMVFYNADGQAEIIFAKGGFGEIPVLEAGYDVSYLVGGGTLGNLLSGTITEIGKDTTSRGVVSFTQPNATLGGTNLLSLEEVRYNTLSFQRTLGRAVSLEDAASIAKEISSVYNAVAIAITNYWFLYAIPTSGTGFLTPSEVTAIEAYLTPKLMDGVSLVVSSPAYIQFTAQIDIYILPNYVNADVLVIAQDVFKRYTDGNEQAKFGEGIARSTMTRHFLSEVAGTQNVDFNELCEGLIPNGNPQDIVAEKFELMDWATANITINVIGGQ